MNVAVVLTGDGPADVVDDRLIEAAADFVKQTGVMTSQIEVTYIIQYNTIQSFFIKMADKTQREYIQ